MTDMKLEGEVQKELVRRIESAIRKGKNPTEFAYVLRMASDETIKTAASNIIMSHEHFGEDFKAYIERTARSEIDAQYAFAKQDTGTPRDARSKKIK